jgi:DNA-binding PadR family transcriptional regulator
MGVFTPFNFFLMKFNWNINYIKCLEYGLNLSQWAVMDMMMNLSSWAEWKEINWEIYYYLSASKLVEELPLISDKKNTFLVILKVLKEKWLIDSILDSNKSRYKVTQKWKSFLFEVFQGVEKNQDKSWKKSRLGVEINQDNNNTSYNNTRINILSKDNIQKSEDFWDFNFSQEFKDIFILYEKHRKEKKSKLTQTAKLQLFKKVLGVGEKIAIQKIQESITNWRTWVFFDKKWNQNQNKKPKMAYEENRDFNFLD